MTMKANDYSVSKWCSTNTVTIVLIIKLQILLSPTTEDNINVTIKRNDHTVQN